MTDFTLSSGNIMRPYKSPWGAFPTKGYALSSGISSNAIVLGRIVGLDVNTDSNAAQILPSSQTNGDVLSTAIVGVAAESPSLGGSSTNTRGTVISVWEANPSVEFRANTFNGLLASSNVGKMKEIKWDSTLTIHLIDLGGSTAASVRCIVTGLIDAEGDSGGAVSFRFLTTDPSTISAPFLAFYR